jgi:hypothetical protein
MSSPIPPGWPPPTVPQPALRKRVSTSNKIALSVLGVIVFCLGGAAILGTIVGDPKPHAAVGDASPAARFTLPAVTSSPAAAATADPAESGNAAGYQEFLNSQAASPTPKPARKATSKPKPKPKPKPTTEEPTQDDVYYANCAAVRAAGAAPIYRGDPGYSRKLDRDGDGVGCE